MIDPKKYAKDGKVRRTWSKRWRLRLSHSNQGRGLGWFFYRLIRKSLLCVLTAIFTPIALLLRVLGVRFLPDTNLGCIGGLAIEPDCYIKEGRLGLRPDGLTLALMPSTKVANRRLADYWRGHLRVVTSPMLCGLLRPIALSRFVQYPISRYANEPGRPAVAIEINSKWKGRPPLLTLKECDRKRGWRCLHDLGLPEGVRFVCIHCRESTFNWYDEHVLRHRNSRVETYFLAMEWLARQRIWSVRIGFSGARPLPALNCVIDYACSGARSDWMDIFLCASCEFFLGSSSGLYNVPFVFGVPCALVNLAPASLMAPGPNDLGIPKLIWSCREQRYLTFREILSTDIGSFGSALLYDEAGLDVVDNSPEEIRDVTMEMLERLHGTAAYTAEDESLQVLFKSSIRPTDYTYGSAGRVGRQFLRDHRDLLQQRSSAFVRGHSADAVSRL